jgi:hypothetical protein
MESWSTEYSRLTSFFSIWRNILAGKQGTYERPKRKYFASDDTSFTSGDSPATLDVNATLSRNSVDGYIKCDGAGDIIVTLSVDGTTYGNDIRMKTDDTLSLKAIDIDSIKITHSGTDSSYRVFAL